MMCLCGQISYVLRNIIDANRGVEQNMYGEYEIGKGGVFKHS